MRFANRRGKSHYDLRSLVKKEDYFMFQYNLTHDSKLWGPNLLDYQSLIPICNLDQLDAEGMLEGNDCHLFQPVFTDIGMCHSYNPTPVLDILKPTHYTKAFKNAFEYDLRPNASIHMGTDQGDALTFYLYGNFHRIIAMLLDRGQNNKVKGSKFFFGISNNMEYFGIRSSKKVIRGGYKVTYKIQAMEIVPSEDLRSLTIESRKCRFADEYEGMNMFKIYTKAGCEFEQNVKRVKDICRCLPWYIPHAEEDNEYPICDLHGNLCFKTFMNQNQSEAGNNNECLPNCHEIQFTSAEVLEKLDPEEFCDERIYVKDSSGSLKEQAHADTEELIMMKKIEGFLAQVSFIEKVRMLKTWSKNKNMTFEGIEREFCKKLVTKHLAKVTVMFERLKYLKTSTSLKVTFPDKLGAFGEFEKSMSFLFFFEQTICYVFQVGHLDC